MSSTLISQMIDTRGDTSLREVAPGLYVGGILSPRHAKDRYETVINLYGYSWPAKMEPPPDLTARVQEQEKVLKAYVKHHLIFRVDDRKPYPDWLLNTAEEVVRANRDKGVLIHCFAGVSRSVSLAYAMCRVVYGMDNEEASKAVQHPFYLPCAQPLYSAMAWTKKRLSNDP